MLNFTERHSRGLCEFQGVEAEIEFHCLLWLQNTLPWRNVKSLWSRYSILRALNGYL